MNNDKLIEICKDLVLEGKAYHDIKTELEKMSLENPQLKMAMQKTDDMIVAYELEQQAREKHLIKALIGVVLCVLGLLLNIFSAGNTTLLGVMMLIGGYIAYQGYKNYQTPPSLSMTVKEKRKGKFDRF